MILFFSDLHLGLKHCSKQENDGLYTSEVEAFKVLDYIYDYVQNPENQISLILFGGDWFHTNTPSSLIIKKSMEWFNRINELKIPFFLIPGNHECTVFSNSLSFIHEMNLPYTHLIDNIVETVFRYLYITENKEYYDINFVPYSYSESMKERDVNVENNIIDALNDIKERSLTNKQILVSHFHETFAKMGSESLMIAKNVEVLNLDEINNIDLLLLGHIHREQVYTKNGITVMYPGSSYYQDKSDVNQRKGFYVIQDKDNYKMEVIPSIRKYHKININQVILNNLDIVFQNRKFAKGDVLYFDCKDLERSIEIEDTLLKKCNQFNFIFGSISYDNKDDELENVSITITEENPKDTFSNWVNALEEEPAIKQTIISKGFEYIEKLSAR